MSLPLIEKARLHAPSPALIANGRTLAYGELLGKAGGVAQTLLNGARDLEETRIAYLISPGFAHVATLWGIWMAGGIAVPLAPQHPTPELDYVLDDSDASQIVVSSDLEVKIRDFAARRSIAVHIAGMGSRTAPDQLPNIQTDRRAMILYTSGTTSRPKGVVSTHSCIQAQVESLVEAWQWSRADHILHVLPLHHIHGIINVLCCALYAGACCEFLHPFAAERVFCRIAGGGLTLFMAVPTIYQRLIEHWESEGTDLRTAFSAGCARMRLMVSGSAALPVNTLERWKAISGHVLLERYGMTEIGMGLSNPLHGDRTPGCVGSPLPGVEVRCIGDSGAVIGPGESGEIQVRGPTLFQKYWRRPEETVQCFNDGWFRTGDIAEIEDGNYRILGRRSVDIIKTGGYKVSALEIEETLRTHPNVQDCAVVGLADPGWGECVCAALILKSPSSSPFNHQALRSWAKQRLAPYKVPHRTLVVCDLPRNAMGKVQKPAIKELFSHPAQ